MAAKILPLPAAASPYPSSSQDHRKRQAYRVWMKSLVFNGNGCTVYGPDGGNYGYRGGREVFFMDCAGKTLIRIRRKGFGVFRRWEVCQCHEEGFGEETSTTPWFSVQRAEKGGTVVALHGGAGRCYRVNGCRSRKPEYRVVSGGAVVAEVARKQTAARVVLTLTVGSEVDHLLVLGLVVVCGLMKRSL